MQVSSINNLLIFGFLKLKKLQVNDMVICLDVGEYTKSMFYKECVYGKQHHDVFLKKSSTSAKNSWN